MLTRWGEGGSCSCEMRLARAACVREVCVEDPARGTELVLLIQEALGDEAAGVVALGLQALAALCEADVVDFYTGETPLLRLPDLNSSTNNNIGIDRMICSRQSERSGLLGS